MNPPAAQRRGVAERPPSLPWNPQRRRHRLVARTLAAAPGEGVTGGLGGKSGVTQIFAVPSTRTGEAGHPPIGMARLQPFTLG